jgi:DNA-binding PadR family transcriptional regulator
MEKKRDVLQGTLDLMVLQTVDTLGPLHGYAIAARIEQVSHGALQLNMGTLYPALMRLENAASSTRAGERPTPIAARASTS